MPHIKCKINTLIREVKILMKENKPIFIYGLICIGIGFLLALKEIDGFENEILPVALQIKEESLKISSVIIFIVVVPIATVALITVGSGNRYLSTFLLGGVTIYISKQIFLYVIIGMKENFFLAFLSFICFVLPLFCVDIFILLCYYAELKNIGPVPCGKKFIHWIPLGNHKEGIKRLIKKYIVTLILFNLIYSFAIIILFYIIF